MAEDRRRFPVYAKGAPRNRPHFPSRQEIRMGGRAAHPTGFRSAPPRLCTLMGPFSFVHFLSAPLGAEGFRGQFIGGGLELGMMSRDDPQYNPLCGAAASRQVHEGLTGEFYETQATEIIGLTPTRLRGP